MKHNQWTTNKSQEDELKSHNSKTATRGPLHTLPHSSAHVKPKTHFCLYEKYKNVTQWIALEA